MKKLTIAPEVLEVLEQAEITATAVKLPGETLERKLYLDVNKVLEAAGGKWSRREKAHLFTQDPRQALGLAIETGAIDSPADEKVALQAYYTPPELADKLAALAELEPGQSVLEPSAGGGALVAAALKVCPEIKVTAYDINPEVIPGLQALGAEAEACDFLAVQPDKKAGKFDRVLMNPPFTKRQDLKHVLHALNFLAPGGRLVAIMSGTASDGLTKLHLLMARIAESCGRWVDVEAGAFKESGTNVKTVILVVDEGPELWAHLIQAGLFEACEAMGAVSEMLRAPPGGRERAKEPPAPVPAPTRTPAADEQLQLFGGGA